MAIQGFGLAFLMYSYMELSIAYFDPTGTRDEQLRKAGEMLSLLPETIPIPPCCLPCYGCRKFQPNEKFLREKVLLPTKVYQLVTVLVAVFGIYMSPYHFWNFGDPKPFNGPWNWSQVGRHPSHRFTAA